LFVQDLSNGATPAPVFLFDPARVLPGIAGLLGIVGIPAANWTLALRPGSNTEPSRSIAAERSVNRRPLERRTTTDVS
jgi:hypothetical protein